MFEFQNPAGRDLHGFKMPWFLVVCLFIRKLSEIVKKQHTGQIFLTCHSPEAMKSSDQDDQLLNTLDKPTMVGPEM